MVTTSHNTTYLHPRYYRNFVTWIAGHLFLLKKSFSISYVFLFLGTVIIVLIPLLLQYFFDVAIKQDSSAIYFVGIIFISLYILNLVTGIIGAWITAIFSENVVRNVQLEFFESIHTKSMEFHDASRTGELLSMATSDSRQLSWMLTSVRMLSFAIFTIFTTTLAMIYLDVRLLGVFLLFVPFMVITMVHQARQLGPVSVKRQELFAAWQATIQENLQGIRALRTLSNRDREFQKYDRDLLAVREILIKRGIINARYYPTLFIYLAMGVTFIAGSALVFQEEMTIGTLIAFNVLLAGLQVPNEMIRSSVFLGSMGFAGGKRVYDVIDTNLQLEDGNIKVPDRLQGKVEFKNVSFRYNRSGPDVLQNLNFVITPGQTVAVIGHTGCGKTTVGKLIQRLYDPAQGVILVDGVNIKEYPIDEYRKHIGVIEQDIFLFSASIKDNILYGYAGQTNDDELIAKMKQMTKAAQIHDFIMTLPKDYDTVIGERGITLSGGQRQRLAIARAFMIDPPILIMDDHASIMKSSMNI